MATQQNKLQQRQLEASDVQNLSANKAKHLMENIDSLLDSYQKLSVREVVVREEKRRYGFFRCPKCHKRWESSWAICVFKGENQGNKVYKPVVKQSCKACKIMVYPHKTEELKKSEDLKKSEPEKGTGRVRHIKPNRPHREDLCSRCRTGEPCTSRRY